MEHPGALGLGFDDSSPCPVLPSFNFSLTFSFTLSSLDKIYTLSDEGFREVVIVHDPEEEENLPSCFPSAYGDDFERRLLAEQEADGEVRNYAP